MNFKEGTRRFALLVGCLGSIAGGFGSYMEMKPAIKQKAIHDRFERLATSNDVQKERKCRLLGHESGCSQIEFRENTTLIVPDHAKEDWFAKNAPKKSADPYAATAEPLPSKVSNKSSTDQSGWEVVDVSPVSAKANQEDDLADIARPFPSLLNKDEIKIINWGEGKDYLVESIETEDGNTLHPTSLPSRWVYLLAVILPLVGFLLPWGLIRSIQWVATGFLVNQESKLIEERKERNSHG
jgi:hypothetical protein